MKISIAHNTRSGTLKVLEELKNELIKGDFEFDDENPDIVISVGGDGTLLKAFHHYEKQLDKVLFIGVHTGHLGFYTDWRDYEVKDLVANLKTQKPEAVSYPLLEVTVKERNYDSQVFLALNESTIKRTSKTFRTDVLIKDEFFESFRGDGLCVSTPTGSTAYSKSLGGAIIHPRLEAIQLNEIASINNRIFRTLSSPMIIPPDEWFTIEPEITQDYWFTIDSDEYQERDIESITYRVAPQKIRFAKYRHTHFWSRVEDAFIGEKIKD